ncbi:MAG TPA: hypothetical protein VE338_15185 [Ktedonobacterales bacterium]|nr:hypothetical protein [Ktedonobacterales bacterium]
MTQQPGPAPAPHAAWPLYDAPTRFSRAPLSPQRGRVGRGWFWAVIGFLAGCLLTLVVAMAALAPAPAPSVPAQSRGAALTVTLTDTLLTQSLGSNLGAGVVAVAQPRAHIQANGRIVISGVLQGITGAGSDITVVTQPYVSQHTLAIRVLRASVAGFALPPSSLNSMRDQINQQLAQSSRISLGVGSALVVSGVSFANGSMTLTYAPARA